MSRKQKSSRNSRSKTPASSAKVAFDFEADWFGGGRHDAVTAAGQVVDFKTSTQRGDDMIDAMRKQIEFYKGSIWEPPRRGKSVTQGGMLWNDFHNMGTQNLPVDEYRWARAMAEVMRVPSSYYVYAPPEIKRERERVLEYLAQFDTHQGRRAAGVVARRVQFVLEGVEPRPRFDISKIRERAVQTQGKMLGASFDKIFFDGAHFLPIQESQKMSAVPELPYIDTIEQAEAMGAALNRALHFSPNWAPGVFKGTLPPHWNGKKTLNEELRSRWDDYMSAAERVALVTAYVEERMKR